MLKTVLNYQGKTHASEKSFNNHWGVPLTLARMPSKTEYAILELGMNKSGEIRQHSLLSKPHVALITSVNMVHMSSFKNLGEIALAKAISPRFLNDDIWTILTEVINATCGLDKRLCCLISPLLFIPNSRIAYSVLDGIRARVKGTPQ